MPRESGHPTLHLQHQFSVMDTPVAVVAVDGTTTMLHKETKLRKSLAWCYTITDWCRPRGRRIRMRATGIGPCVHRRRQSTDLLLIMTFAGVFDVDGRLSCLEVAG
jgi:hypothetical protein